MWNEYFTDWDYVQSLLPENWQAEVKKQHLLNGGHKFSGENKESILLRTLLMHLVGGLSLRETSAYCKATGLVDVSDVAILKRLRKSEAFFAWCIEKLKPNAPAAFPTGLNFRVFDASAVKEPGPTGTLWRFHYSINLRTLRCDEQKLTDFKTGEGFKNYTLHSGDVILADRGYSRSVNIAAAAEKNAYVLIRFTPATLPLFNVNGESSFQLQKRLRGLTYGQTGDWAVKIKPKTGTEIDARLIAEKLPPSVAAKYRKNTQMASMSHGDKIQPKTLEMAGYLMMITTLPSEYSADDILTIFRLRWQIELVFKRLKSLLGTGHLPKHDDASSRAWLTGKIFAAVLIEKMLHIAEAFSPSETC